MPTIQVIGFKPQFVPKIVSGEKTHTIRKAKKKNPVEPGQTLHLYTGLRTPECSLVLATRCVYVEEITISRRRCIITGSVTGRESLNEQARERFAKDDGFNTYSEMVQFLGADTETFKGKLISWQPLPDLFADFLEAVAFNRMGEPNAAPAIMRLFDSYSIATLKQFEALIGKTWAAMQWNMRRRVSETPEAAPKAKETPGNPIVIH